MHMHIQGFNTVPAWRRRYTELRSSPSYEDLQKTWGLFFLRYNRFDPHLQVTLIRAIMYLSPLRLPPSGFVKGLG